MDKYTNVDISNQGWGSSYRLIHPDTMEKVAEECFTPPHLVDVMKTLKPRPDGRYILLNAIGALEYWSATKNGDGFPEWSLKSEPAPPHVVEAYRKKFPGWVQPPTEDYGYKSYPTHAKVYALHCFPKNTLILMADRSRKPIETIVVGDLVTTASGRKKPVTRVMRRPFKGAGVKLTLQGELDNLACTENHEILIYRRSQIHCRHNYNKLTTTEHTKVKCLEAREPIGEPIWVSANKVEKGDYLVQPIPKHGSLKVQKAFARLVGWVASEGYLGKKGAIAFTFSDKAEEDILDVLDCFEELGAPAGLYSHQERGTVTIQKTSKELHERLSEFVQGTWDKKSLTGKVLTWDRESLLQMFGAYVSGDGCVDKQGHLRIRSASKPMMKSLADVIRSLGAPASLVMDHESGVLLSPMEGYGPYISRPSGYVSVLSAYQEDLCKYSRKKRLNTKKQSPAQRLLNDRYLVRVSAAETVELNEEVFNFEVADEHTYVAAEVGVHNCNKDPEKSIGDVVASAYNDVMHRIELVVFISRDKAPDVVDRIDDNIQVPFSMGSRLKADMCSVCSNLARTRSEYCGHLNFSLNSTLPDGTKVFSYNHFPKFFDISAVRVPADKSAWSLKKVASATESATAPPTKLATLKKKSDLIKRVPVGKSVNLGSSPINPKLLSFARKAAHSFINRKAPLDQDLEGIVKLEGLKAVIPALTSLGVIINPQHLITLSNRDENQIPDKYASEDTDLRIMRALTKVAKKQTLLDPIFTVNCVRSSHLSVDTVSCETPVFKKYAEYLNSIDLDIFIPTIQNNPVVDFMLEDGNWICKHAEVEQDSPFWLPFASGISTL